MTAGVRVAGNVLRVLEMVEEFPDHLATELAHRLQLTPGTVLIHLSALADAGLITRTRRSGMILNRSTPAGTKALAATRQPAGGAE